MAFIKLDDALQVCSEAEEWYIETNEQHCAVVADDIYQQIANIPTADVVEVKHGHFVRNERNIPKMKEFHEKGYALSMNEKSIFYTCSCCGSWCSLSQNYCSECGARMDGTPKERGGEK